MIQGLYIYGACWCVTDELVIDLQTSQLVLTTNSPVDRVMDPSGSMMIYILTHLVKGSTLACTAMQAS